MGYSAQKSVQIDCKKKIGCYRPEWSQTDVSLIKVLQSGYVFKEIVHSKLSLPHVTIMYCFLSSKWRDFDIVTCGQNCLVTNILRNILFCFPQKKVHPTGLEQHKGL